LAAEALDMARGIDDPALIVASLGIAALIHPGNEFPEQNAGFVAEIDRLSAGDRSLGGDLAGWRPGVLCRGLSLDAYLRSGRGAEVEALLADLRSRVGDSHNVIEQSALHYSFAWVRAARGDASAALEHGRQAIEWAMQSQNLYTQALGYATRGCGLFSAGRFDEAVEQVERALDLAIDRGIGKGMAASRGLPLLVEIQLRRGNIRAARAAAERGIELARTLGYRHAEARNLVGLVRALVAGGEAAGAAATLAQALELATALDARDLLPRIEEARADLARHRNDAAGCERALRTAARLHRANGEEWLATQAEARIGA
jgi:tetratricopeptide (TPR) repeat protein